MSLDNLVLRDRATERLFALSDCYSSTAIVDTAGAVQERYGYNAFGQPRVMSALRFASRSDSTYDWESLFANDRWDGETCLYQVRYRYLHPNLGRWSSRDILEYDDAVNLYSYARNNPVNAADPYGTVAAACVLVLTWEVPPAAIICGTLLLCGSWYTAIARSRGYEVKQCHSALHEQRVGGILHQIVRPEWTVGDQQGASVKMTRNSNATPRLSDVLRSLRLGLLSHYGSYGSSEESWCKGCKRSMFDKSFLRKAKKGG